MKFRVLLQRPAANQHLPRNPFLIRDIFNLKPIRMLIREWEVEARNRKHVEKMLKEARELNLDTVRGYSLLSIEPIASQATSGSQHET